MTDLNRIKARESGEKLYKKAKKCKYAHDSLAYVASGVCVECQKAKAARNFQKNKDKILEYQKPLKKKYYQSHKRELNKKNAEYRKSDDQYFYSIEGPDSPELLRRKKLKKERNKRYYQSEAGKKMRATVNQRYREKAKIKKEKNNNL